MRTKTRKPSDKQLDRMRKLYRDMFGESECATKMNTEHRNQTQKERKPTMYNEVPTFKSEEEYNAQMEEDAYQEMTAEWERSLTSVISLCRNLSGERKDELTRYLGWSMHALWLNLMQELGEDFPNHKDLFIRCMKGEGN